MSGESIRFVVRFYSRSLSLNFVSRIIKWRAGVGVVFGGTWNLSVLGSLPPILDQVRSLETEDGVGGEFYF